MFGSVGDCTQGFEHARQMLYYWATSLAIFMSLLQGSAFLEKYLWEKERDAPCPAQYSGKHTPWYSDDVLCQASSGSGVVNACYEKCSIHQTVHLKIGNVNDICISIKQTTVNPQGQPPTHEVWPAWSPPPRCVGEPWESTEASKSALRASEPHRWMHTWSSSHRTVQLLNHYV